MRYLIDTHSLIWFIDGNENLSVHARKIIENENNDINETGPENKNVNEGLETSVVFQAFVVVVVAITIPLVFLLVVLKKDSHPFKKLKNKLFSWSFHSQFSTSHTFFSR